MLQKYTKKGNFKSPGSIDQLKIVIQTPQLESSIKGTCDNELVVARDINAHNFVVVAG